MSNDQTVEARLARLEAEVIDLRRALSDAEAERDRIAENLSGQILTELIADLSAAHQRGLVEAAAEYINTEPEQIGPLAPLIREVAILHERVAEIERTMEEHNQQVEASIAQAEKEEAEFNRFMNDLVQTVEDLEVWAKQMDQWVETVNSGFEKIIPRIGEISRESMHKAMLPIRDDIVLGVTAISQQLDLVQGLLEKVRIDDSLPSLGKAVRIGKGAISLRLSARELLVVYEQQQQRRPDLSLAEFTRVLGIEEKYRTLLSERTRQKRLTAQPRRLSERWKVKM